MKRLELFEFEDYQWLPSVIRKGITSLIMVLHRMMGTADVIADLILQVKEHADFSKITDLGSGSGGPMIDVISKVNKKSKTSIDLVLSDFYPNSNTVQYVNSKQIPNVRYEPSSVDATKLETAPAGLKTMIASFHHMNPVAAQSILRSAQESGQPILIYEIAKNNIPTLLWWILLPISLVILIVMSLVMTLFVRPLTLSQIILTYPIPIIPFIYAWDGQASLMRTYTFEDIESLIADMKSPDYIWEIGDAKKSNGKNQGYYIMGMPL